MAATQHHPAPVGRLSAAEAAEVALALGAIACYCQSRLFLLLGDCSNARVSFDSDSPRGAAGGHERARLAGRTLGQACRRCNHARRDF